MAPAPGTGAVDETTPTLPLKVLRSLSPRTPAVPPAATWACVDNFQVPVAGGRRAFLPDAVAALVRDLLQVPQRSWSQTGEPLISGFGGGTGHVHASDGPEYTYHLALSRDNEALASVHRHGISIFRRDAVGEWQEQEKLLLDTSGSHAARRRRDASDARQGQDSSSGQSQPRAQAINEHWPSPEEMEASKGTIPHRLEWVGPGSSRLALSSHSIRGGPHSTLVANKGSRLSLWHVPAAATVLRRRRKRKRDTGESAPVEEFTVFHPTRPAAGGLRRFWELPQTSPPSTLSVLPGPKCKDADDLDAYVAVCGYRDGNIRLWSLDSRGASRTCLFRWSLLDAPCRPLDADLRVWDARDRRFVAQEIPVKGAAITTVAGPNGEMRHVLLVLLRFSRQLLRGPPPGSFFMAEPEISARHVTRTSRQGVVWALDLGGSGGRMTGEGGGWGISAVRRMSALHDSYGKTMQLAGPAGSAPEHRPFAISGGEGGGRNLLVHNVVTGALEHELVGHTNTVHTLSVEGQWLASGSRDGSVRLWRWQQGEAVRVMYAGEHKLPFFNIPAVRREEEEADATARAVLEMSLAYRPPTVIAAVVGKGGKWIAGGGHELCVSGKTVIRVWGGKRRRGSQVAA